jgi:GTP-binding protein
MNSISKPFSFGSASFLTSAHQPSQLVDDSGLEVAFAGRSNSGKSSAINTIVGQKSLARTSRTPGRTQLINFFELDASRRLVDLPGYGYARVPDSLRKHWRTLMEAYFSARESLVGMVLMVDIRRGLTDFDYQMLDWVEGSGCQPLILLTKADKLSRGKGIDQRRSVRQQLGDEVPVVLFSAPKRQGVDDARQRIRGWLEPGPSPGQWPGQ